MSEFVTREECGDRADFCNKVFDIIVQKNDYDIDLSLKEAEPLFEYFDEYVYDVYEVIDSEIPLWQLHNLLLHKEDHGEDNWGYTQEEYDDFLQDARNACELYYCMKTKK